MGSWDLETSQLSGIIMRGPCSLLGLNYAVFMVKLIQSPEVSLQKFRCEKHDQALGRTSSPITKRRLPENPNLHNGRVSVFT